MSKEITEIASLVESARRTLSEEPEPDDNLSRHGIGGAVRNLTRAWSILNPDFDGDAWYAVSFLLEENWAEIVAHHEWAVGQRGGAERWSNPWKAIAAGNEGLRVHPADLPYITAFNNEIGSRNDDWALATEAWPDPWVGPVLDADVLVLGANPGWAGEEDLLAMERFEHRARANLGGHEPIYYLDPEAADTPGGRWYRNVLLKELLAPQNGLTSNEIAANLAYVDLHGYHARRWHPIPVTLPTQKATFELIRRRIGDGTVVVITRCARDWRVAVPELATHPQVFTTRSTRTTRLSPKNLGEEGWQAVFAALRRGEE